VGIVAKLNLTGLGLPPYIPSYLCSIQTGRLAIRLFAIGICGPGDNQLFALLQTGNRGLNSSLQTNRFLQDFANIIVDFLSMLVMLEIVIQKYQLFVWELLAVAWW
jgi:hypothetical protein